MWSGPASSTLVGHEGKVYHLAISPDGTVLASASQDGTAKLWNVATAQLRHTLRGHAGEVNCVAFAPDGKELATASDDRTVRFWDPVSGREHSALASSGLRRRARPPGGILRRWEADSHRRTLGAIGCSRGDLVGRFIATKARQDGRALPAGPVAGRENAGDHQPGNGG